MRFLGRPPLDELADVSLQHNVFFGNLCVILLAQVTNFLPLCIGERDHRLCLCFLRVDFFHCQFESAFHTCHDATPHRPVYIKGP